MRAAILMRRRRNVSSGSGAPCPVSARPRSALSRWLRGRRCGGARSWSARRRGYNRARWRDKSREPRESNNDCRRAALSASSASWRADGAQQAAQEGLDLFAARPFGGAKHGGDEAALAIEHDDWLKAIFIVMGVEQSQLLAAMRRVERVVDIERDAFGNLPERLAIKIDHGATHAQQRASVGQVFQSRDRRLRTQFAIRWREIERHLEHGIAAETGGVVAVFIACRDHQQPKADDVGERVRDLIRRARVFDTRSHAIGDAKALLHLAQNQNPAVRRQQTTIEFGDDCLA